MPPPDFTHTNPSLLRRLRDDPADQAAWADLVRRYGPLIYQWCTKWRLQPADAEDVTQTVLAKLAGKMATFTYDPALSFRGYLRTLAHYAWCDLLESRGKSVAGSGDTNVLRLLDTTEARDDLVARLEQEFDHELMAEAMLRVASRVEARTWEAFRLLAVEGVSGADATARLGMKVATVFVAKSKVIRMLQEEVRRLDGV